MQLSVNQIHYMAQNGGAQYNNYNGLFQHLILALVSLGRKHAEFVQFLTFLSLNRMVIFYFVKTND